MAIERRQFIFGLMGGAVTAWVSDAYAQLAPAIKALEVGEYI